MGPCRVTTFGLAVQRVIVIVWYSEELVGCMVYVLLGIGLYAQYVYYQFSSRSRRDYYMWQHLTVGHMASLEFLGQVSNGKFLM